MRLLISVCFLTLASAVSFVSTAQDETVSSKTADAQPLENKPAVDAAKPDEKAETQKVEAETESFDLDSFFKQGEENSKKGMGCQRPPEPIA